MIEYLYEKSIFDVKRMTSGTIDGCPDITYQQINSFNAKNYVFAVCPFGVLILGHKDVPENNMKFAANVIANLIDMNGNGLPTDNEMFS
jgi:hypothetical protein